MTYMVTYVGCQIKNCTPERCDQFSLDRVTLDFVAKVPGARLLELTSTPQTTYAEHADPSVEQVFRDLGAFYRRSS